MLDGPIYAFDVGVRLGYAIGEPGRMPRSGTVVLKATNEPRAVAFGNLIFWLNHHWSEIKPAMVIKEAPLPLQGFRNVENAQHTVRMTYGLHSNIEGMCARFGVPFEDVADSTIRRHFIGRARMGTRVETKRAVVKRCHVLGYFPADCNDDNRADALAAWDFAAATWGRSAPRVLHMFNEAAA